MAEDCPRCQRKGLPILPVLYSSVPKEGAPKATPLSGQFGKDVVERQLTESVYLLRGLEPGYIYLLYPNKVWKAYLIDSAGYPRYYPDLTIEDMPDAIPEKSDVEACERQNNKSHYGVEAICIDDPDQIKGAVYIAYSRHKWTKNVRDTHAGNPSARMQLVAKLDGSPFPHAEVASQENLTKWVIDFQLGKVQYLNAFLVADGKVQDRAARADRLLKAMLGMSGDLKKPGLIMALHDPVGITQSLNLRRNRLAALTASTAGIGNQEKSRKRIVAELIEGIRLGAEANPGPWYDRNYGPERFLKRIDQGGWKACLDEAKALKTLQARIKSASADFVQWKESPAWKTVQSQDFDGANDASSMSHERMVANCVAGSGLSQDEREKVWYAVLKLPADSKDNWLYRALATLHPGLLAYIATEKKEDKEYDLVKNASDVVKDWTGESVSQLATFYAALYAKRQAGEATAALIESISAMLFKVKETNPKEFNRLWRAVAATLIARADVVPQPVKVKGIGSLVAAAIYRIANVRELPTGAAPVVQKPIAGVPGARKGSFGPQKAWELSEATGTEIVFKPPNTTEETKVTVAWVLRKLRSGAQLNEKELKALKMEEVDLTLPAPKVNPYLENHIVRVGAKAAVVLSAGAVFFQVYSFRNALETYGKGGSQNQIEGSVGVTTAVLSGCAGLFDIRAATLILQEGKLAAAGWALWAGRLSAAAGVIEGVYLAYSGRRKIVEGDVESGWWTIGSGVFIALGGVASYGVGAAFASELAGGAGVVLEGGPVVWTLVAIAFIGAALYCGWQAWATDDNNMLPIEYWLDNGTFGNRKHVIGDAAATNPYAGADRQVKPFSTLNDEVLALQRVLLVVQGRLSAKSFDEGGYLFKCTYDVAVPRYESGTRLEIRLTGIDEGRQFEVGRIVCENGAEQPAQAQMVPKLQHEGPRLKVDEKARSLRVEGLIYFQQDPTLLDQALDYMNWRKDTKLYVDKFEMQVSYWPDRTNMPQFESTLKAAT